MLVLVTRPRIDAERTASKLAALRHEALIDPVIEIEPLPFEFPKGDYQAVVFTSANGARALPANIPALRELAVFVVGDSTAEAARACGFQQVESADGDAHALAELIGKRVKPGSRVLYLAGEDRAGDLPGMLAANDIRVEVLPVYKAQPSKSFRAETIAAFRQNEIGAALHYSERSVAIFSKLADAAGLRAAVLQARHICISPAAAKPLINLGAEAAVANAPNEAAMLELLRF